MIWLGPTAPFTSGGMVELLSSIALKVKAGAGDRGLGSIIPFDKIFPKGSCLKGVKAGTSYSGSSSSSSFSLRSFPMNCFRGTGLFISFFIMSEKLISDVLISGLGCISCPKKAIG